jgi:hypothetical protein
VKCVWCSVRDLTTRQVLVLFFDDQLKFKWWSVLSNVIYTNTLLVVIMCYLANRCFDDQLKWIDGMTECIQ